MKRMREFLTSYLPVVKKKSPHTVTAYRDALNVYMAFLQSEKGIKFRDDTANGFCRDNIVSFMEWLRLARGNEVTTVNQRLSHIRSFCKYMTKNDVLSAAGYEEIRDISDYKDTRTPDFVWMSIDEVKLMLSQPDIRKKNGVRDRFFLSLMYESGCRDDEIPHLRVKDFVVNKNGEADLHIFGAEPVQCTCTLQVFRCPLYPSGSGILMKSQRGYMHGLRMKWQGLSPSGHGGSPHRCDVAAQKRADPNPEGTPECLQGTLVSDGEWYADTVYVHYSTCIYEQDDPFMFLNLFAAVSCGML